MMQEERPTNTVEREKSNTRFEALSKELATRTSTENDDRGNRTSTKSDDRGIRTEKMAKGRRLWVARP